MKWFAERAIQVAKASAVALAFLTSSLVFADADFNRIPQEPLEQWSTGRYIVPNEPLYSTFAVANEGKRGALIAVGSFRALAAASQGDFDYAILMDADSMLVDFNRKQIELLKTSDTVEEFIAKIADRPDLAPKIKRALRGEFLPFDELSVIKSVEIRWYVNGLLGIAKFDESLTFLTNPKRFARIKKLAADGRILAIAGDLAGAQTLAQVGEWLRSRNSFVGALDVSNAPGYLMNSSMIQSVPGQFIRNLERLPWLPGAIVNFTEILKRRFSKEELQNYRISESGGLEWSYFSLPYGRFIDAMKQISSLNENSTDDERPYSKFVSTLKDTTADLHLRTYLRRKAVSCEAAFR